MKRFVVAGVLMLLGAGAVVAQQQAAVEQDNLMKSIARAFYGSLGRMARERSPYDQGAVDAALAQLEQDVGKIQSVFATNPKDNLPGADYGSSQKIWQNKADFDSKIPPVLKTIADFKGKVANVEQLKAAFRSIDDACNVCHETYRVKLK
jgi:cytochrome c556